jgi:hypothetical protein
METKYTDRDKLRDEIERMCVISGKGYEETDRTIIVHDGPKYFFRIDGSIKSIIKDGISYNAEGERVMR